MAHVSPEGRPPHHPQERRSAPALVLAGVVVVGGLILLLVVGGGKAFGMGLAYLLILLAVAFPVWLSGIFRGEEEREVRHHEGESMKPR